MLHTHRLRPFDHNFLKNPTAECRGAPFWSWNGKLERQRLLRQLDIYAAMGMGGAHIHVRTGLSEPAYLSDDFLALVRDMTDAGSERGLLTWLYDEDRWPSGYGGGLVTRDAPELRARFLRLTRQKCAPGEERTMPVIHNAPVPVCERQLVAAYEIRLEGGVIHDQRPMIGDTPATGWTGLWAYREVQTPCAWLNHTAYLDVLNPKAVDRFLAVTHARYADALGARLGRAVPAIFTDEPIMQGWAERSRDSALSEDVHLTWSDDLDQSFCAATGEALLPLIPSLVLDRADGAHQRARWLFHDHRAERFATAYFDRIGAWCEQHGLAMTGHLQCEATPTQAIDRSGDVMRPYRAMHLPGIDMLCDSLELTTAKQTQSVARQHGRPGLMSEVYGVTNWDFPFAGHKRQGDWQAALGVILRVHHLTWYSMAGEAKRDYPASFGAHAPWHPWYRVIEDHFSRLAVCLTRGRAACRIALLHPGESSWLHHGPRDRHGVGDGQRDRLHLDLCAALVHGLLDFDYVAESLLPTQCASGDFPLAVGEARYDVVIVAGLETIRASTLDRLEAFARAGGTILIAGTPPTLVDGRPNPRGAGLVNLGLPCGGTPLAIVDALEPWRDVEVLRIGGGRPGGLVHQWRHEDDGSGWLFLCTTATGLPSSPWGTEGTGPAILRLKGLWTAEMCDTGTGEFQALSVLQRDGVSEIDLRLFAAGHVLLRLRAGTAVPLARMQPTWREWQRLPPPVAFERSEPNVLILDRAAWRVGNGDWQPVEEILRIDNLARLAVGLPQRDGNIAQPYCEPDNGPRPQVSLRFNISADTTVASARVVVERVGESALFLDGKPLPAVASGWYVDEDLTTVALGDLAPGNHEFIVTQPICRRTGVEACYLLSEACVQARGSEACLLGTHGVLPYGDLARMGLPFYGGNATWTSVIEATGDQVRIVVPRPDAAAVVIAVDGREVGVIHRAPWRLDLGALPAGAHRIAVTVLGTRVNTFGALHHTNPDTTWWGPDAWRTRGDTWSDAWQIRPFGLNDAPFLEIAAS